MTINDLRNLDREDVLGWLGLQSEQSRGARLAKSIGLVSLGLVAGTALALLFAPKAGRGLREDIRNRFRRESGNNGFGEATVTREDLPTESASAPQ